MEIKKFETTAIKLTDAEKIAIGIADKTLKELQNMFTKNATLTSKEDGTVIGIDELARVRGILDCLVNNSIFEVKNYIDN